MFSMCCSSLVFYYLHASVLNRQRYRRVDRASPGPDALDRHLRVAGLCAGELGCSGEIGILLVHSMPADARCVRIARV